MSYRSYEKPNHVVLEKSKFQHPAKQSLLPFSGMLL